MGREGEDTPEIQVQTRKEVDFGVNTRLQSSSLPSSARFSFQNPSEVNRDTLLDEKEQFLAQSGRSGRLSSSNAEDFAPGSLK